MPLSVFFWVLFVLWLVLGLYASRAEIQGRQWLPLSGNLLLAVLLFLLGWGTFGFIVR